MEENEKNIANVKGENEEPSPTEEENRPASAIPVKFNKETRLLSPEQASVLAQKGLKFEQIENDYIRLKNTAKKSGLSVEEYLNRIESRNIQKRREELIEQSGGNESLADYVMSLEKEDNSEERELAEIKEMFPEINEIGELPQEVTEASRLSGKNLLDCYLRYLFSQKLIKDKQTEQQSAAKSALIGSLKAGASSRESALDREFIKGLWGK